MIPIALTVAGSDPSGGAGIQADLKTFTRLKVYGMSVITALTAQNTGGVTGIVDVSPEFVGRQWDTVMTDIKTNVVKTGMLGSTETVELVAKKIQQYHIDKFVLDPVFMSSSGTPLLDPDAIKFVRHGLAPLALLITPNLAEASTLTGFSVRDQAEMEAAAKRIRDMGTRYVLVKGGHLRGEDSLDVLFDGSNFRYFHSERIAVANAHGTGCVLSAAIAAHLARGDSVEDAVASAKRFVTEAIRRRLLIGKTPGPCDPVGVGEK